MLSDKEIICPNNLLDVAHNKKGVPVAIVNAGKLLPMQSAMDAVNENLIVPILIGDKSEIEKCAEELKFDKCIDYKNENVVGKLEKYCPNGIDIYFENVGGEITKMVSKFLNKNARVPICGFISKYNSTNIAGEETPFHVLGALNPKPKHRFFVVTEWLNQFEKTTSILHEHVKNGDIKFRETITPGFENAPQGLRDVLSGKNFGKQIIKIC